MTAANREMPQTFIKIAGLMLGDESVDSKSDCLGVFRIDSFTEPVSINRAANQATGTTQYWHTYRGCLWNHRTLPKEVSTIANPDHIRRAIPQGLAIGRQETVFDDKSCGMLKRSPVVTRPQRLRVR
jgi:hypothetical protein